ncbi:MAG TPA: NADH-quinone oxidoreductase subunit J [Actinomycetota bacterium]|jgi:NADH:ubiquinone oxidoreductase subunit 6 (subunit J)|nr:NADH-quinone oxidoreductase subunit J [Actinomycetota bacterium]
MVRTVIFWLLGVLAVVSGVGVFKVSSMARATFLLLASFLCVAGELLLLGLAYLGVLVVLMMTMEMVIMAVFMVMYMMNPAGLMPMVMVHNRRGAQTIAISTFAGLAAGIFLVPWPQRRGQPPADATVALGQALMGSKMLVMMVIGVALLATMIAVVLLATHRGRYDRYGDELERRRPDDPVPGGLGR